MDLSALVGFHRCFILWYIHISSRECACIKRDKKVHSGAVSVAPKGHPVAERSLHHSLSQALHPLRWGPPWTTPFWVPSNDPSRPPPLGNVRHQCVTRHRPCLNIILTLTHSELRTRWPCLVPDWNPVFVMWCFVEWWQRNRYCIREQLPAQEIQEEPELINQS